ncbi:MAG: hypothetical protein K2H01_00115 [Ruminococcus sp.]|nr:hypothetical protein [Ruminococcus sp.]
MNKIKKLLSAITSFSILISLCTTSVYANTENSEKDIIKSREAMFTLSDTDFTPAEILSNADSGFLFADQLDDNNKLSYSLMEEYLKSPSESTITIELKDKIVLERSSPSINRWSDEEYSEYANAVIGAVMPGVVSFTLDYPEVFWLNFSDIECGVPTDGMSYRFNFNFKYKVTISKIVISPNYDSVFENFDSVMSIRESITEKLDNYDIKGETDYDKCMNIFNSIINETDYVLDAPYAHSIAGILYDNKAVCEGYAKTFKILCDRENIPCITVLGNFNADNLTAHMWNYVFLDGAWYGCDPTYGESTNDLTYFMRGSKFFNQNHTPESPYSIMTLSFPDISENDYIQQTVTTTAPYETTTTEITTTTSTTETTQTTSTEYTIDTEITAETTTYTEETTATTTSFKTTTSNLTSESSSFTEKSSENTSDTTPLKKPICGDINEDETVSLIDLIILRKYLIGITESVKFSNIFDCNKDGSVNIFDASELMYIILNQNNL